VAAVARSRAELDTLAAEHERILPVVVDLSKVDTIEGALEPILAEHGPCEVLVNNAGYALRGAVEEIDLDAWRREFEVNLFACARLCQLVVPEMRRRRHGRIVNVSSVAGRVSTPFNGAYSATKFALEAMNDALRIELRPFGVDVIVLQPGPVATDFRRAAEEASGGRFDDESSPYITGYRGLRAKMKRSRESGWTAERVAELAIEAIESPRPKSSYAAYGPQMTLGMKLRELAPSVLDRLVARRAGWGG
jgi:short-subunit dehydrogenase